MHKSLRKAKMTRSELQGKTGITMKTKKLVPKATTSD